MFNFIHLYILANTCFSAFSSPQVPDMRELGRKRGELHAVMRETKELPSLYAHCKENLATAKASLKTSKEQMDITLGTGAIAMLQKEIDEGTAVVQGIKLRCEEYATQIAEVACKKVRLTEEVAGMRKKPKGQVMFQELDRMAAEAGRV